MFLCHTDSTDDTDIFSNTNLTNDTNEGAQTWLFHTDSADFTDIFEILYRHGFRLPAYDALRASG